ncbi:hypothetical protein D9619_009732 [Psilocybe cf. subviscida]|uniref:Uncharacterized protein n=1 Tax=Psilocybe cf. subviscida TaxID=2480587 RepID=A0A8H5BN57_9AGAR|nr:hypothetical protein D9619_009732 [Psilocybe cf. subviscida]
MKSSKNEREPPSQARAHYRDRHLSLGDLPEQSTKHGFRTRVNKTSNEDLRRQAHQRPMTTVFSLTECGVQEQAIDELAYGDRNNPRKKSKIRSSAATASSPAPPSASGPQLQVRIGPPVPRNNSARVTASVPAHGMEYGPLSPSSDNTPVSATYPLHGYQFQDLYPTALDNAFEQFVNGGVQSTGMGFPGSSSGFSTFDREQQIPLDPYQSGLMPLARGYPSQVSYPAHGTINGSVYCPPEHLSSEFCSGLQVNCPLAQLTYPGGHIVSSTNYAAGSGYPHNNGQYNSYAPNF